MPSPFPGMDPYLESPSLWPDVHHRIISVAGDLLGKVLQPKYYTRIEERMYISDESDRGKSVKIPDLMVKQGSKWRDAPHETTDAGVSIMAPSEREVEVAEPVEIIFDLEVREAYLTIVDTAGRQVVTVVEVLSPTNKVADSAGRDSYMEKRRDVLHSSTHLVEIDLLRDGKRTVGGVESDYLAHVSRYKPNGRRAWIWPIQLHQRLPAISIPLRPNDSDVFLDLQQVLSTAYEQARYDLQIDYSQDPVPPLTAEQAEWAKRYLSRK